MTRASHLIPSTCRKALRQAGPLSDAIKLATWTLVALCAAGTTWGLFIALTNTNSARGFYGTVVLPILLIAIFVVPLAVIALVIRRGSGGRILFLRAHRSESSSQKLRYYLQGALGTGHVLTGIRAPRLRTWWTWLGPIHQAVACAGSPLFDLRSSDHNWLARLFVTMTRSHGAIIDVRAMTRNVANEVALAWLLYGSTACVFVVDQSRTLAEWRADIQTLLPSKVEPHSLRLLHYPGDEIVHSTRFALAVHRVLRPHALKVPSWSDAAFDFVRANVSAPDWKTRFWEKDWLKLLIYLIPILAATSLVPRGTTLVTIAGSYFGQGAFWCFFIFSLHCLLFVAAIRRRRQERCEIRMADAYHMSFRRSSLAFVCLAFNLILMTTVAYGVVSTVRSSPIYRGLSKAEEVLNELMLIDAAIDQFAVENNLPEGARATWENIRPFLNPTSRLGTSGGWDPIGNSYIPASGYFTVGEIPRVPEDTKTAFSRVTPDGFWRWHDTPQPKPAQK